MVEPKPIITFSKGQSSRHTSIESGNDVSKDSTARQANAAQHHLHEQCEYYHMGSDSEGSIVLRKMVVKPTHYRVRTNNKSERLFGRRG